MLKWIKVRQNTSATTSASTTPTLSVSHREVKKDEKKETRVEAEVKKEEEGEDSGMEREDSVCNIELSELKKVRTCFVDFFSNLELI